MEKFMRAIPQNGKKKNQVHLNKVVFLKSWPYQPHKHCTRCPAFSQEREREINVKIVRCQTHFLKEREGSFESRDWGQH